MWLFGVFLQYSLLENPVIARFESFARSKPVVVRACPTWDLSLALQAIVVVPYDPLEDFVIEVTRAKNSISGCNFMSARRVSKLQALSVREPFPHDF